MTTPTSDSWQPGRPWYIVMADLDLAHVFLPLSTFTFEPATRKEDGAQGYKIAYSLQRQKPHPDCFCDTFLQAAGSTQPTFEKITKLKTLPVYDRGSADDYVKVAELIASHMNQDRDVKRLEGTVRIPCHAHGTTLRNEQLTGHSPMWIKTLIHVYQFKDVVNGDRPLLVIRAPLSPVCPLNGDGTILGSA